MFLLVFSIMSVLPLPCKSDLRKHNWLGRFWEDLFIIHSSFCFFHLFFSHVQDYILQGIFHRNKHVNKPHTLKLIHTNACIPHVHMLRGRAHSEGSCWFIVVRSGTERAASGTERTKGWENRWWHRGKDWESCCYTFPMWTTAEGGELTHFWFI